MQTNFLFLLYWIYIGTRYIFHKNAKRQGVIGPHSNYVFDFNIASIPLLDLKIHIQIIFYFSRCDINDLLHPGMETVALAISQSLFLRSPSRYASTIHTYDVLPHRARLLHLQVHSPVRGFASLFTWRLARLVGMNPDEGSPSQNFLIGVVTLFFYKNNFTSRLKIAKN